MRGIFNSETLIGEVFLGSWTVDSTLAVGLEGSTRGSLNYCYLLKKKEQKVYVFAQASA